MFKKLWKRILQRGTSQQRAPRTDAASGHSLPREHQPQGNVPVNVQRLVSELHDRSDAIIESAMTPLALTRHPVAEREIAKYLDHDNYHVRMSAAFCLQLGVSAATKDKLAGFLDLPEARLHGAMVQPWEAAAFTLGRNADARAIEPLIMMLRKADYTVSMATEYQRNIARHYPTKSMDLDRVSGFVLADILVDFGELARRELQQAVTHGGPQNWNLCYPLRQLGWSPATDTEHFFWHITDPGKSQNENSDAGNSLEGVADPRNLALETFVRSLVVGKFASNSHCLHMGGYIHKPAATGQLPLWRELAFPEKYSEQEYVALVSFCQDLVSRWETEVTGSVAIAIEEALKKAQGV